MLGASLHKSPSCRPAPAFGTPEGQQEATGLLNRDVPREVRHKLQIRGFINTEEDHSIKCEELENLEELGKK